MWNGGGETYMWHCTNYMFSSDDDESSRKQKYDDDSYANLESPDEESSSFYDSSSGPPEEVGYYDFNYEYDYRQGQQRQTYCSDSSSSTTLEDERRTRAEQLERKQNRNPRKALAEIQQRREQQRKNHKTTQPAWMVDPSASSDDDDSFALQKPAPKRLKTLRKKKKKFKTVTQKQQEQEAAAAKKAAAKEAAAKEAAAAAAKEQELHNLREELVTEYMELLYHLQNKRDKANSLISEIYYYYYYEQHYAIYATSKEIKWCDRGLVAVEHFLNRLERMPLSCLSRYESEREYRKVAPYQEDFRPNCPLCKERKFSSLLKMGLHIWNHKGKGHGRYRQETEMKDPSLLYQDIQDRRKAAAKQLDEELQAAVMMDESMEEWEGGRDQRLREVLLAYAKVNLQAEKKGIQNWLKTGRVKVQN